jgi:hypothetical protein
MLRSRELLWLDEVTGGEVLATVCYIASQSVQDELSMR